MKLSKILFIFGFIVMLGSTASAGVIYELIDGGGTPLALLELAIMPMINNNTTGHHILNLRITDAGANALGSVTVNGDTGTWDGEQFSVGMIVPQGTAGLKGTDGTDELTYSLYQRLTTVFLSEGFRLINIWVYFRGGVNDDEIVLRFNRPQLPDTLRMTGVWVHKPTDPTTIPEPSTYALLIMGICVLGIKRHGRKGSI